MRIAIIGAGNVGGTLGRRWLKLGHEVVFGVRDPQGATADRLRAELAGQLRLASPAEAAAFAEIVVLTVPSAAAESTTASLGDLTAKVLVDATNPVGAGFAHAYAEGSVAERVAAAAPGAHVVKAFNTTGFNIMADPQFGTESASLFVCGDDSAAMEQVQTLAAALGFDPVDCGPLRQARLLEHLALLWISMAMAHGHGRGIAFRLLTRASA